MTYTYDFVVIGGPSVFLLSPETDVAREWADEHLPQDALTLGNGIAVEWRYLADILTGIQDDGLRVGREW